MNRTARHPLPRQLMALFLALALGTLFSSARADESPPIEAVRFEPTTFRPSQGESANLFFYLSKQATVTVTLYDSDHFPVATVVENWACVPGTNRITWNGKDNGGSTLPDEAYYATIAVGEGNGATYTYDPSLVSGGETLGISTPELDKDAGTLTFSLSQPARVRLRAGIHEGPLCRTLLAWTPQSQGTHTIAWDGKDASGIEGIWDHERLNVVADAFTLPQATVIIEGSPVSASAYWEALAKNAGSTLLAYRIASPAALKANEKAKDVTQRALLAQERHLHKSGITNQFLGKEPALSLSTAKSNDKDIVNIHMALDAFSKQVLNETRYEYVLYVDNVRQEEKETGYSPYTWAYNTKSLPAGDHVVTVNVCTIDGRIGVASTTITVKK